MGKFTLGIFKKICMYVPIFLNIKDNEHFTLRPMCTTLRTSTLRVFLIDTGFVLAIYELKPNKHKNRVESIVNFNVYDTLAFVS